MNKVMVDAVTGGVHRLMPNGAMACGTQNGGTIVSGSGIVVTCEMCKLEAPTP